MEELLIEGFTRKYEKAFGNARDIEKSLQMLQQACNLAGKDYSAYIKHNISVGNILLGLGMDKKIVLAGMNHNIVTLGLPYNEVEQAFGAEVLDLIDNKERLEKSLRFHNDSIGTLRKKLLIVMSTSPEIFMLQLSEALDKARHFEKLNEQEKKNFLAEAKDVYAPLALKLGIYGIGLEINDIVFREENPDKYSELSTKLERAESKVSTKLEQAKTKIVSELTKSAMKPEVSWRIKGVYSTHAKMNRKNLPIEKIYDIAALRVIVRDEKECYEALGIIHSIWKPVPGEFDDYIAKPKENGYRSLHTTLFLSEKVPFEVQIRTPAMQDFAEYGLASHWRYKGNKMDREYDRKIEWLKQVLDWQGGTGKGTQMDIFGRNVFAMTPKGEVIELPEGASALDFAYSVHSDLGNKCVGAKVNGKLVQLETIVRNGDVIEIMTSEKQRPKASWLSFAKTPRAKQKIRSELGLDTREPKKAKIGFRSEMMTTSNMNIRLAKCCTPVPGDEIMGVKTTKRKISVHRVGCPQLEQIGDKKIPISWEEGTGYYEAQLTAITKDRIGILKDILGVFSRNKAQITSTVVKKGNQDMNFCTFGVRARNRNDLDSLARKISELHGVVEVRR